MAICLLPCWGCEAVRTTTEQERSASFAPLNDHRVGSIALRDHLVRRTAFLINSTALEEIARPDQESIVFQANLSGDMILGSAAAVDARGYFVTAAHCIDGQSVSIGYLTGKGIRLQEARIVWSGFSQDGTVDFAILHIPARLEQTFSWARTIAPGDWIASAGVNSVPVAARSSAAPDFFISVEPIAGRIAEILTDEAGDGHFRRIRHDSPVAPGNSGGPAIDEKGRLLGVNSTGPAAIPLLSPTIYHVANAVIPDPAWVKQVIDRDARARR